MPILDKADYLLIPSGYKTSKVYSVLPTSGVHDFTFARTGDGTRINEGGVIETKSSNIPRLNHYNGNCPSLLVEPSRTNICKYSEEFDNVIWTKTDTTVTANFAIAPDNTLTADKLTFTTTNDQARAEQIISVSSGQRYAFSLYIKSLTGNVTLRIGTSASTAGEYVDITATSEWQRFEWTSTANSTSEYPRVQNISGISGTEILVWGAQFEQYDGATAYIKTTSGNVTRNLDDPYNGTTFTLGTDATFYFDFEAHSYNTTFRDLFMFRNTAFNRYFDLVSYTDSNIYYARARVTANGGTLNYIINFGERDILFYTRNKVAIRLFGNEYKIFVNGSLMKSGSVTGNIDVVDGNAILSDLGYSGSTQPGRKIYNQAIFDKTMTDSELLELTTL